MRFTRSLGLLSLSMVAIGITAMGCGGGGNKPEITVAFSTAPPSSLQAGATAQIAASVSNDSATKGVTWSCAPANTCGTFNPTATASGTMTTYTAPATVPAGGSVTITATSVSDTTKSISATVTITAPPITIAFTAGMAPPPSINFSTLATPSTAQIAATVTNDSANKGVTWSCVPAPASVCGSFAPPTTPSGTATTYTAPLDTSSGTQVIITATSIADPTQSVSARVALSVATKLSVNITQFPAQLSLQTGLTAMFGATVSNDSAVAPNGVTWSCSDASNDACGTFAPTPTPSGATTTYTAPATVPNSPQVTITATSVADPTQSASLTITIFAPGTKNSRLNGQYTFLLTGQVGSENLPTVGSVNFDGNGNVTAGEFDQPGTTSNLTQVAVTGKYSVSDDGRGSMSLTFSTDGGVTVTQSAFNFALTSNSHGVIVETDGSFTGSGSLDQQSAGPLSAAQITGGYSFALEGRDNANKTALVEGGIFTAGGAAGTLTNGIVDTNDSGIVSTGVAFTGTFTAPDTFGRGTISASNGGMFTYYIVKPGVLRVVETDVNTTAGGSAYGQGSAASFTNASLTGKFVFGLLGQSGSPSTGTAVVGQFTTDSNGTFIAGTADSVSGDGTKVNKAVSLTNSTYAISGPRGTVSIVGGKATLKIYLTDPAVNLLDPNNASGGGGALIIEFDAGASSAGLVIPQANSPAFSGNYAINMTALQNQNIGVDFELDLSGQTAVDAGKTSYSGHADFSGTALNFTTSKSLLDPAVIGNAIAGSVLTADVNNAGHFTGTLTITQPDVSTVNPPEPPYFVGKSAGSTSTNAVLGLSYYQASSTQLLFIQIDGGEVAIGVLEQ